MRVHILCRNHTSDRIIPRMSRILADRLGWTLSANAKTDADMIYLSAYFEVQKVKTWPDVPVAAYFTHREEMPPGNGKAKLFDEVAAHVDLRIATCALYAKRLSKDGPTAQVAAPLERDRFVIAKRRPGKRLVAGFSGYTYRNHRKGEDLARALVDSKVGKGVDWRASGRGWPVPTTRYSWSRMPGYYQSLDILVCTSRVEGIPMPPLEALACGVSVVVPEGVGLLDELPQTLGIHRYTCGDEESLEKAVGKAMEARGRVDRKALRAATERYSVDAWVADHERAFEELLSGGVDAGIALESWNAETLERKNVETAEQVNVGAGEPMSHKTGSTRGIYCVAFGDPARTVCSKMMSSAKKHMPDIPIALCSDRKIGPEDVLIKQPDSDIGGRRAKLKAYQLAPAEWKSVLYLDADTVVVAPIYQYFQWIEAGWEFVICKDPHLMDTMHSFERRNNKQELMDLKRAVRTLHTLQYNGGVWAFARNKRVEAFFGRWLAEWERYAGRDQGALIRAMYTDPLKVLLLGNEWNTFPKYTKGIKTAGLMHYPGKARRWKGLITGRIDGPAAWDAVAALEGGRRGGRK